jgi:hypothetical protein
MDVGSDINVRNHQTFEIPPPLAAAALSAAGGGIIIMMMPHLMRGTVARVVASLDSGLGSWVAATTGRVGKCPADECGEGTRG